MIDAITAEHSVLFLGSGFSTGATNRLDRTPPTGNGLKRALANLVRVDPDDYGLTDLAEYCSDIKSRELYALIQGLFRIRRISSDQQDILSAPWLRIYTTNFDDSAEFGRNLAGLSLENYSFEQEKPRRLREGTIVHLHGAIRNITEDNVLSQIVLGETAYVRQHLEKSPWYDQFLYDLRFSSACYFLGYSLSDQHIAALLTKNPASRQKTFFIEPDRVPDKIFANKIQKYGEIEPIGLDGFAALVRRREKPAPISDLHALKAFKFMESHPDRKASVKPTVNETRDFLIHGKVNLARLMASLPQAIYAVPRENDANRAANLISNNRSLIIDSRLGNGKSIFQHLLHAKLIERGYMCFVVRNVDTVPLDDLDFLNSQSNVLILFDNYATAQNLIEALNQSLPSAKFVVEVRTSLFEVRLFEIESKIPKPYGRINLNKLTTEDRKDFIDVCRSAGVVLKNTDIADEKLELRDLLLKIFQNQAIKDAIRRDLDKALSNPHANKIITVVFLMQLVQADVDPDFIRLVSGVDPFEILRINVEGSEEILTLADGSLALRSSVFAEFAMQQFVSTSDLSNAVHDCAVFCANRKDIARYRTLLTLFMQYSRVRPMYNGRNDGVHQMRALYERLRWYPNISDEPLFWLQFAILEIDDNRLADAKRYIEFSYEQASKREGFLTYQIDTQYLRLLLEMVMIDPRLAKEAIFDDLLKYISIVAGLLSADSHRSFAIKILESIPDAVARLYMLLSEGEKLALSISLGAAYDALNAASPDFLAQTGTSQLRDKLSSHINQLKLSS